MQVATIPKIEQLSKLTSYFLGENNEQVLERWNLTKIAQRRSLVHDILRKIEGLNSEVTFFLNDQGLLTLSQCDLPRIPYKIRLLLVLAYDEEKHEFDFDLIKIRLQSNALIS